MNREDDLRRVASNFQIIGKLLKGQTYGSGHINDTYRLTYRTPAVDPDQSDALTRFILQRINPNIFKRPVALMENIARVTTHIAGKLSDQPDQVRRVLTLIPSHRGQMWHIDEQGAYWRAYKFIENARTFDTVQSTQQAFESARAFGRFQRMLVDLPAPALHNTLPDFHDTPKRFLALEDAIARDVAGRLTLARAEVDFAVKRRYVADGLVQAALPERVTHNDTKLSNVMLDDSTNEGICVIDLDTVMPGVALYDFGDMVRTTTTSSVEDERDLSKVTMQFPMFQALVRGYLSTAGDFLTGQEKSLLVFSAKLITLEQGIRFLTDYLLGDTYYKIRHQQQNLDRCRTQFQLMQSIEEQEAAMHELVASLTG